VRGLIRLTHPFPSLLNGIIATAVAVVAGGGAPTALRLGVAMVALQASIGTLNDLLDADRDAGRVPPKPIPAGLVSPGTARSIWVGTALAGLLLVVPSGGITLVVAGAGLSIGYAYDRYAKGTAWSWVPFAVGIPLLPVYGWVGTGAALPPPFAVLVPCAVLAGADLAIANSSADVERDIASGAASVAVSLGLGRAWLVHVALLGVAIAVVFVTLLGADPGPGPVAVAALGAAIVVAGAGLGATTAGRQASPGQRERAWESEAAGMGLLATAWLVGLAGLTGAA
jgi:4-hydroxybenzoate polyprenyltransferase